MAHYAELDENNIVIQVIPAATDDLEEELYKQTGSVWKRTSYNTRANKHLLGGEPYRYNYAGIGFTFNSTYGENGAFIPPSPFPSWQLSNVDATWKAPKPYPQDGKDYNWVEEELNWVLRDEALVI